MGLFLTLHFFMCIAFFPKPGPVWGSEVPCHLCIPSHVTHLLHLILSASSEAGAAQQGTPHSLVGRCNLPKVTALSWGRTTQGGVPVASVPGPGARPQLRKSDSCSCSHGRLTHKEKTIYPGTPRVDSQFCHLQMTCHQVSLTFSLLVYQMGQRQNPL